MPSGKEARVFQLNDYDWWVGYDLEGVKAAYLEEMGVDDSEFDNPHEVTGEALDRLKFVDGDDPINEDGTPGGTQTFREALRQIVERGDRLPCFFASTEY